MIHNLLDFIIPWIWFLVGIIGLYYLVWTARRQGITVALKKLLSYRLLFPALLALSLSLLRASIVFIHPYETGVVVSLIWGQGVREEPFKAGLHWIVPLFEEVVIYPISWQTYTMSSKPMEGQKPGDDSILARTADGQEVIIDASLIFRIEPAKVVKLHIEWQERYIEEFIRPGLRWIIRADVSQYPVNDVNSDRRQHLEIQINKRLETFGQTNGIILGKFMLRNITFSSDYITAVEQKQAAMEAVVRTKYEAEQIENLATGEAAAILVKAEAEAKARLIKAEAEAKALQLIADVVDKQNDLLTYNYIDKLSPNLKAMLLPHNTPLILPLPSSLTSEKKPPLDTFPIVESDKTSLSSNK